jgi:hypothetical protein
LSKELILWQQQMENSVLGAMKGIKALSDGYQILAKEIDEIKQDLTKRIYLSNTHLIELRRLVREKASEICKLKGYEYKKAYRFIIQAIWRSVNDQYNVPSYRELPEAYYKEIVEKVQAFNLPTVIEERISAA